VIGDATGKGFQAALVVHAVRSLWVLAENEPDFSPEDWLTKVNQTLFKLGKDEAHTMTLGIVECRGDKWTYWSSAHVPLVGVNDEGRTTMSMARGNIAGVGTELSLTPKRGVIGDQGLNVLLSSDGMFDEYIRTARSATKVLQKIESEGLGHLAELASDDDLSAIWLRTKDHPVAVRKKKVA
jgi:serine phosphatase RsbU (regulator of sigma subunit)